LYGLHGGIRYQRYFLNDIIQPFVRVGHGWSWYNISDSSVWVDARSGTPAQRIDVRDPERFLYPPFWPPWRFKTWVPNTLNFGIGLQLSFPTGFSAIDSIGISIRATRLWHSLGTDNINTSRDEYGIGLVLGTKHWGWQ
jgi:hypothetical protein